MEVSVQHPILSSIPGFVGVFKKEGVGYKKYQHASKYVVAKEQGYIWDLVKKEYQNLHFA
jgi:hypothetical protein